MILKVTFTTQVRINSLNSLPGDGISQTFLYRLVFGLCEYKVIKLSLLYCIFLFVLTAQREEKRNEDRAESASAPKKAVVSITEKQSSSLTKNLPSKKSQSYSNTSLTKPPLKPAGSFKGVIPKKPWPSSGSVPSKQSPLSHGSSVAKKAPPSSSLSGGLKKPSLSSTSAAAGSNQAKASVSPAQSQPNSQIRQNIRRSLKEILWKRWEFKTLYIGSYT